MKVIVGYSTKEKEYISEHTYRHIGKKIDVEPVLFMRSSCGRGSARNRYYYQVFFKAPDDAEFTELYQGEKVCRSNIDRKLNKNFNPKLIEWDETNKGELALISSKE